MGNIIKVGMADLNVCKAPDGLTTLGLGSCIGLTLYDPVTKIGGIIMICTLSSAPASLPTPVQLVIMRKISLSVLRSRN